MVALSGTVTMSPLAIQEAIDAVGLPVLGPTELAEAKTIGELIGPMLQRASA